MKKLAFGLFAVFAGLTAAVAAPSTTQLASDPCEIVKSMQGVFKTLRILAFVGAAFCIGGWAWGYITAGDVKKDDLKDKGVALLVGFTLLFGIGMVLNFLPGLAGCASDGWGVD
ncbi:MAG: hypothetical protein LBD50_03255 [Rickettsiales bacterium]|jgi:hypothetical protein|nr:hypothetical protein [Rickettsiales bacterium]